MRIETRKVTEYTSREIDVDFFITDDGKEFRDQKIAKSHQINLERRERLSEIEVHEFDAMFAVSARWYYLKSIDDLRALEYSSVRIRRNYDPEKLVFPAWYLFEQDDDSCDVYYTLSTVEEVRKKLSEALENLPK